MNRGDVKKGDEVKNGRNGAWGRVDRVDCDAVTGRVLRIYVQRRIGPGQWHATLRWWDARNITMVEGAK